MTLTAEQRAQIVDLLIDNLLIWQVAERVGVSREAVASVAANWRGRINWLRRERAGRNIDGSPRQALPQPQADAIANAIAPEPERTVTIFVGDDGRMVYTLGDPDAAIIRTELPVAWGPEDLTRLCRKMGTMRDGQLEQLARKISGGG